MALDALISQRGEDRCVNKMFAMAQHICCRYQCFRSNTYTIHCHYLMVLSEIEAMARLNFDKPLNMTRAEISPYLWHSDLQLPHSMDHRS